NRSIKSRTSAQAKRLGNSIRRSDSVNRQGCRVTVVINKSVTARIHAASDIHRNIDAIYNHDRAIRLAAASLGTDVTGNIYVNIFLIGIRISPGLSEIERQRLLARKVYRTNLVLSMASRGASRKCCGLVNLALGRHTPLWSINGRHRLIVIVVKLTLEISCPNAC